MAAIVLSFVTACGASDYTTSTVRWDSVQAVPGGVIVTFGGGTKGLPRDNPCWQRYRAAAVSENDERVVVGVWVTRHKKFGPCADIGYAYARRVPLRAPLDDREVRRAPKDALSPFEDK